MQGVRTSERVTEPRQRRRPAIGHRKRPVSETEEAAMPGTLARPTLTTADRCDRCGAAAKARAVLPSGGELLFCGHHARAHEAKLRELSVDIQSES